GRPPRALPGRARRGQGRDLQQRPDGDDRARLPPRSRRLHGRGRHRAQGEPRRARATGRLSGSRRRELHEAHLRPARRRFAPAVLGTGANDEVGAPGEEVLMQVALKIWRYDSATGDRALKEYEIEAPDWATLLDCKTPMYDIAQSGHVPVISAMGNLPIHKDLVVDMDPFWSKFKAMWP